MIHKDTVERILDSYLNVLYEQESKNESSVSKKDLLKNVWLRCNKKTQWYCKTKYQENNKPEWI